MCSTGDTDGSRCCCCCRSGRYIFWALKDTEAPEDFGNQKWKTPRSFRVLYYYILCFLLTTSALSLTFYTSQEKPKYFIYLTNWSLILAFLNYTLIIIVIAVQSRESSASLVARRSLAWLEGMSWVLNNCNIVSVMVTAGFWVAVYPNIEETADQSLLGWIDRVSGHGLVPVLITIDVLLVNAKPYRRRHFYQPVLFGLCYAAFSYVYFTMGGVSYVRHGGNPYIYSFLDWRSVRATAGNVGLMSMAMAVVHFVIGWVDQRRKEEVRAREQRALVGLRDRREMEPLQA